MSKQKFKAHVTGAQREKLDNLDFSLIPFEVLEALARVLKYGANKYAAGNWEKGLPVTQLCASMLRHIWAYMRGEEYDESGLHHTDHIIFGACALCWTHFRMQASEHFRKQIDDRRISESFRGGHKQLEYTGKF